jgi:hypothetical protein
MRSVNLYQFNGDPRVPRPLRQTLLETFEFCNTVIRPYYRNVADAVLTQAQQKGFRTIVELGAGHAPLTRLMVEDPRGADRQFVVCDLIPAVAQYRELEQRYPGRVTALTESVDFTQPRPWDPTTLLVLCAAIHHVPTATRCGVLQALSGSGGGVMVFVPVRKHWLSLLLSVSVVFPALALPLLRLGTPGTLRRLLWCWLLPAVPLMAAWDGLGGSLRQWTDAEWRQALAPQAEAGRVPTIVNGVNEQLVAW